MEFRRSPNRWVPIGKAGAKKRGAKRVRGYTADKYEKYFAVVKMKIFKRKHNADYP